MCLFHLNVDAKAVLKDTGFFTGMSGLNIHFS